MKVFTAGLSEKTMSANTHDTAHLRMRHPMSHYDHTRNTMVTTGDWHLSEMTVHNSRVYVCLD